MKRMRNRRRAALRETAITIPIILLVSVSIFESGRTYRTWQVPTNAAREDARIAVLPDTTDAQVQSTVRSSMTSGRLTGVAGASVSIVRNVPPGPTTAARVTIKYPFTFIVLDPVARLVCNRTTTGAPLTMQAAAMMRNE